MGERSTDWAAPCRRLTTKTVILLIGALFLVSACVLGGIALAKNNETKAEGEEGKMSTHSMVTVICEDSDFGIVTTDKTEYRLGDTIVLKVHGERGYGCDSLTINEKEVTVAADDIYSFAATADTYIVKATFGTLFYSNTYKAKIADPFVLDNTKIDGYYYMYGTDSNSDAALGCYRSENLMDWEDMGYAINRTVSDEVKKVLKSDVWAPEVAYDEESETYYMFFSARPEPISTGDQETDELNVKNKNNATYIMMVAKSKSPDKDFTLVDFTNRDSCGVDNLREIDEQKYPEYYAKYALFDPGKLGEFCRTDKTYEKNDDVPRGKYIPAIDSHPYEDETGKYLFWVDQELDDRICAVKMKNWLTPDWDTATVVICANYYTTSDYMNARNADTVPYDLMGGMGDYYINEGPELIKHDGNYYLTYSTGAFAKGTYQVIQAVAKPDENGGPLGPYRKLKESEGAILLSSSKAGNTKVVGAGHHSFVTAGGKLYMVYHRNTDPRKPSGDRNPAIDEVKWIHNSEGLPVMYVNGPTCTPQPRLDAFSKYTNIAGDAAVSTDSNGVSNIDCLTDGFLSISNDTTSSVINKVGETTITSNTTFTFTFDSLRDVRGIMVYNSKKRSTIFEKISKIELVYEENGAKQTRIIENVVFESKYYKDDYVTLGAAAYAEFATLKVESVKITVDVPNGQEAVGISEIKILGK